MLLQSTMLHILTEEASPVLKEIITGVIRLRFLVHLHILTEEASPVLKEITTGVIRLRFLVHPVSLV